MGDGSQEGGAVSGGAEHGVGEKEVLAGLAAQDDREPPSGGIARYANCADTGNATGVVERTSTLAGDNASSEV